MPKKKDQSKIAEGLARGLSNAEALRQAGYSETTIEKKGYMIVHRPLVLSALTEALERQNVSLAKIIKPVADALQAEQVIVISYGKGRPPELIREPDHRTRLQAHDRAVALFGGAPKQIEMPPPPRPPIQINFIVRGNGSTPKAADQAVTVQALPRPATKPFKFKFRVRRK